jgi:hypothetical protein
MNERHQNCGLLRAFVWQGDQPAFADVVRRHLDLVYATALRKLEAPGAAEEVAQNVFVALARKAWQFAPDEQSGPVKARQQRPDHPIPKHDRHPGKANLWV